jgi:hypothetical protein
MIENSKRTFAQKDHHPFNEPIQKSFHNQILLHSNDSLSIVPGEGTRIHFEPMYSNAVVVKPMKKQIPFRKTGEEAIERGKRPIKVPPCTNEFISLGRKHNVEQQLRRSEECDKLCVGWTSRTFVRDSETGDLKSRARAGKEYDMEGYMNRKQRVKTIEQMRNFIPQATPGDKYYYESDREPGFYAKGGIIPGSTIQLRVSAKPTMRKKDDPANANKNSKKFTMTYAEKQKIMENEYEKQQVYVLTNLSSKLNQDVPSWENRTGFYLVKPEDENY